MRVIAGERKGQKLKPVPGKDTRPTTDKVKESLFSIIGPYFDNERVLDLFAGSGGLGIEALSRGAKEAVFVDQAGAAIKTIRANLNQVRFDKQAVVIRSDWQRAIKQLGQTKQKFDLLFLDPPYRLHLISDILVALKEQNLLAPDAIIVAEHEKSEELPETVSGCSMIREANYGITVLSIYTYKEETMND